MSGAELSGAEESGAELSGAKEERGGERSGGGRRGREGIAGTRNLEEVRSPQHSAPAPGSMLNGATQSVMVVSVYMVKENGAQSGLYGTQSGLYYQQVGRSEFTRQEVRNVHHRRTRALPLLMVTVFDGDRSK